MDGYLGCFLYLAIINNAVYKFLYRYVCSLLLSIYLGVELLGHMVTLFSFLRNC